MEHVKNREIYNDELIKKPLWSKLNVNNKADNEAIKPVIEIIELYFAHKKIYNAVKK